MTGVCVLLPQSPVFFFFVSKFVPDNWVDFQIRFDS